MKRYNIKGDWQAVLMVADDGESVEPQTCEWVKFSEANSNANIMATAVWIAELQEEVEDCKAKIRCLVGYLELWQNNKNWILERPAGLEDVIQEANIFLEEK